MRSMGVRALSQIQHRVRNANPVINFQRQLSIFLIYLIVHEDSKVSWGLTTSGWKRFLIVALALTSLKAESARIVHLGDHIQLTGKIVSGDAQKLEAIISQGETVFMNSRGGDALEGLRLYQVIKAHQAHIKAPRTLFQRCQSACAIAGLGGKTVQGRLAFHMPQLPAIEKSHEATAHLNEIRKAYVRVMQHELGIDDTLKVLTQTGRFNFYAVDFYPTRYKNSPTEQNLPVPATRTAPRLIANHSR